jgi:hypothetical protein
MVLDQRLPSVEPQSFFELTCISFEESQSELYTVFLRTSSSCFRDVGGGDLFLALVSKTGQSRSMIFKSDDYAGEGRC